VITHNLHQSSRDAAASCSGRATHGSQQVACGLRRRCTSEKCSRTMNWKQSDIEPVDCRPMRNRRGHTRLVPCGEGSDVSETFRSTGSRDDVLTSMSVFDGAMSVFRERPHAMAFTSPKCSPTTMEPDDSGYCRFRRRRYYHRPGSMSSVSMTADTIVLVNGVSYHQWCSRNMLLRGTSFPSLPYHPLPRCTPRLIAFDAVPVAGCSGIPRENF